jgi:hypothetical protein
MKGSTFMPEFIRGHEAVPGRCGMALARCLRRLVGVPLLVLAGAGFAWGCGSVTVTQDGAPDAEFASVAARLGGQTPFMVSPTTQRPPVFDASTISASGSARWAFFRSVQGLGWDPKTQRVYRVSIPGRTVRWKGGSFVILKTGLRMDWRAFARIPDGVVFDGERRRLDPAESICG